MSFLSIALIDASEPKTAVSLRSVAMSVPSPSFRPVRTSVRR
jgi:hypothetical protein